jgi:hypothetical protein
MKRALALVLATFLVQDKPPVRNTWAGFPDGSWVVIETTESADGKASKKKHRLEVDHLADGAIVCQINEESDVPAVFFEERTIQPGRGVEEGTTKAETWKADSLEVSGRKVDCKAFTYYSKEANAKGKQAATLWTTPEIKVPYREWDPAELTVAPGRLVHSGGLALALDPNVLRYSMSHHEGAGGSEIHEFHIVELDHKLKVGDREIPCAVEKGSIEEKSPKGATVITLKRWLSDAVPGRVVRSEMRGEVRGVKVERIRQVLSLEVAR